MKTVLKLCLAMIMFAGVAFSASHTYRQIVRTVPDTTGYEWYSWDINNIEYPADYLDKESPGSGCLFDFICGCIGRTVG